MSGDTPSTVIDEHELTLEPGQTRFITAAASNTALDRSRVVRVYAPGDDRPFLVQLVEEPVAHVDLIVPHGRGGRWRVAVERAAPPAVESTDKANVGPPPVAAFAVEAGGGREVRLPRRVANRSLRNLLEGFSPRVTLDTRTGGALEFLGPSAKDFHLKPLSFKLKPFKKWIWTANVRDLKNKLAPDGALVATVTLEPGNARYRNGFVKIVVDFEEEGQELEISWAPDADISNLKLSATIGIGVEDGVPVPEDVDVHLPVRLDFNMVPDSLIDGLAGYSRYVQRLIEGKMLAYATDDATAAFIKKALRPKLDKILPGGTITRVQVDEQFVHFFYE